MNGLSVVYIKRGNAEAKARKYRAAFEDYASSLLSRISGDIDMTLEFVAFYRYQLLSYLRAKPVFTLSLPEGDMITDLIVDSYKSFLEAVDSSPFNITGEGRKHLLESVKIVFPWQNDTLELTDSL